MLPSWFLWCVMATNLLAAGGLLWQKNYWGAWIWICYGMSIFGFVFGPR